MPLPFNRRRIIQSSSSSSLSSSSSGGDNDREIASIWTPSSINFSSSSSSAPSSLPIERRRRLAIKRIPRRISPLSSNNTSPEVLVEASPQQQSPQQRISPRAQIERLHQRLAAARFPPQQRIVSSPPQQQQQQRISPREQIERLHQRINAAARSPQQQQEEQPQRFSPREQIERLHQRIRARPTQGHNFYNAQFIDNIPGLSPAAKTKAKRMRVNLRKKWLTKYFRQHNVALPQIMNSPEQQQQQQQQFASPPQIPVIPNISDDLGELRNEDIDQIFNDYVNQVQDDGGGEYGIDFAMDHQQPHPISPRHFQQQSPPPPAATSIPADLEGMDVLFQQREEIRLRNEAQGILDAYCASTKSIADLQNFNRDYLRCIAQTANALL